MDRFGMTAVTDGASAQCPPDFLVRNDKKSSSCPAIFWLRIVTLQYMCVGEVVCDLHDTHVLFVIYMTLTFALMSLTFALMSLTWENLPGPLLLNCTASNRKLGEGLGTRLCCCCLLTGKGWFWVPLKLLKHPWIISTVKTESLSLRNLDAAGTQPWCQRAASLLPSCSWKLAVMKQWFELAVAAMTCWTQTGNGAIPRSAAWWMKFWLASIRVVASCQETWLLTECDPTVLLGCVWWLLLFD